MVACPLQAGEQPLGAARRLRATGSPLLVFACFDAAARTLVDAGLHYEMAAYAHEVGDAARLKRSLAAAVRIAPQFGDGYFELGNALLAEGHAGEAANMYRTALRTKQVGDVPMTYNNLGNTLADLGDSHGALREYRRGLRLAPTFTYLHNGLANTLANLGRDTEAVTTLQRATRVQPGAHYCQYNMASSLRRLKRYAEAEAAYASLALPTRLLDLDAACTALASSAASCTALASPAAASCTRLVHPPATSPRARARNLASCPYAYTPLSSPLSSLEPQD